MWQRVKQNVKAPKGLFSPFSLAWATTRATISKRISFKSQWFQLFLNFVLSVNDIHKSTVLNFWNFASPILNDFLWGGFQVHHCTICRKTLQLPGKWAVYIEYLWSLFKVIFSLILSSYKCFGYLPKLKNVVALWIFNMGANCNLSQWRHSLYANTTRRHLSLFYYSSHSWVGGWIRLYSRLSTTHGHITDCKLDSVVYVGVCVVIFHIVGQLCFLYTFGLVWCWFSVGPFRICSIQVCANIPFGRFTFRRYSVRTCLAGVGRRQIRCPSQFISGIVFWRWCSRVRSLFWQWEWFPPIVGWYSAGRTCIGRAWRKQSNSACCAVIG